MKKTIMSLATVAGLSAALTTNVYAAESIEVDPGDTLWGQTLAVSGEVETKETNNVARELEVSSTAYTANCAGCSGVTATGINLLENPDKKVIAVDPNVIPLGTEVYVEGYGYAVAGDVGSAINGNKIDVFIPSKQEALNWGRKQVTVQILK